MTAPSHERTAGRSPGTGTLVNVCFHGIGRPARELEPGEARYWIDEATFHAVLDLVVDDPRVRISFDDGNASDVGIGLPALLERGLHATFFVLAGRLHSAGSLGPDGVRLLEGSGMAIGTHGMDHVPWRGLSTSQAARELVTAREELRAVASGPVDEAALPLGRYDRRLLGSLRSLGYTGVHTSDRRWAREGAWLQPRFSIRAGDTASSVRREVLLPAPLPQRLRTRAVGLAKRLR